MSFATLAAEPGIAVLETGPRLFLPAHRTEAA
jgi:hypothetical protein